MNRVKIFYRDPRRKQPAGFLTMMVILHLILIFPLMLFLSSDWVQENVYDVSESNMLDILGRFPSGYLLIMIVVVAPLFEEFIFRLWMNLKAWTIAVFTTGATFYLVQNISGAGALVASVLVLILTLVRIDAVKRHMDVHFRWWFYGSILVFGLSHIGNHQLTPAALLFILPQVMVGVAIGMVRVQKGFWAGVALHCLWNGLASLGILYPYLDSSVRVVESGASTFEWTPGGMWESGRSMYNSSDSIYLKNFPMEEAMATLLRQSNPEAIVEIKGLSLVKVDMAAKGEALEVAKMGADEWNDAFGLEIDTVVKKEQTYLLKPELDCEPLSIPGEAKTTLSILDRFRKSYNSQSISNSLEEIYAVSVRSPMEDDHSSLEYILPLEGLDSALHGLKVYNCIDHEIIEQEVTRYIIRVPEF